ncbi:MAG: hypothetical protein V1725_05090 [archaeon]
MFDKDAFIQFGLHSRILTYGKNVRLASGERSCWYVNWRKITEDVFLTEQLLTYVRAYLQDRHITPDCVYGVPESMTKPAILLQYLLAKDASNYGKYSHVLAMGRGAVKKHGMPEDRFFLGVPNKRILVLEDVITTGETLVQHLHRLSPAYVLVLTDRTQPGRRKKLDAYLQEKNIPLYALTTFDELKRGAAWKA